MDYSKKENRIAYIRDIFERGPFGTPETIIEITQSKYRVFSADEWFICQWQQDHWFIDTVTGK